MCKMVVEQVETFLRISGSHREKNKMWTESFTAHVLEVDVGPLGGSHTLGTGVVGGTAGAGEADGADDSDGADGAVAWGGGDPLGTVGGGHGRRGPGPADGQRRERSVLVQSKFQLALIDVDGEVSSLVPAGIDALVRGSGHGEEVSSMEVVYTRGNVGMYRMPAWYVQRGAGLVVRVGRADREAGGSEDGWRDVLVAIGRMLGSSAGSILDTKSFLMREGVLEGWLTQDFPCVESIHRWMRLLPCGGQAGLSEVVRGLRLLELPYHSIRVVVDGEGDGRKLTVEVSGIVPEEGARDAVEMMASRNSRMNRARTGLDGEAAQDGVVQRLLDGYRGCPVVESSEVRGCEGELDGDGVSTQEYEVSVNSSLLSRRGEEDNPLLGTLESVVWVKDKVGGSTPGAQTKARIVYRQALPWEVVADAASVVVRGGAGDAAQGAMKTNGISWVEAHGREHAGLLEVDIDLNLDGLMHEQQKFSIGLNIERPILSVFDYPADMSRGVDIPAAQVIMTVEGSGASLNACAADNVVRAAGQNVLLQLPIPDASMPFNVACFTATLLSLLFGAAMPVLLWDNEELKKVQSAKKSLGARLKRLIIALVVGGTALLYLDLSSRATVIDALKPVIDRLGLDLSV
jgi:hypothetical protein